MNARDLILIAAVAGAGTAGTLVSAEFDLLTDDSYLSPTVLESVRGKDAVTPAFACISATVAAENHYLSRSDAARTASAVGALTGDYYVARWQFGAAIEHRSKLDGIVDPDEGVIPRERYRLYAAYYFPLHQDVTRDRFGGNDCRLLGGWNSERRRGGGMVDEAFVEFSIKLLPEKYLERTTFIKDVTGGYIYAWRPNREEHFLGYSFRATILQKRHGLNLRYLLSFGAEKRAGNSHWAEVQNGLVLSYEHAKTNMRYELGVSVNRDMHRDEWNNQILIAIKRDLLARIIRR